jgi:hypothetical protein
LFGVLLLSALSLMASAQSKNAIYPKTTILRSP